MTIPDSVTSIGDYAFSRCSSITSVTKPEPVTSIAGDALYGCSSLESVTIPDSVTSIGGDAFSDTAYYNDSANWEDGVLYIGNYLIEAETSISGDYAIKAGTKCIAVRAFYGCNSLENVTIPDSVTSIGESAFYGCSNLKDITMLAEASIGEDAFSGCESLATVRGYSHSRAETLAKYLGAEFISLGSVDYQEITVTNGEELLAAIGSNRKIVLSAGTYEVDTTINVRYISGLEIIGGEGVEIISLNPYAPVVYIRYADNITIDGVVMGHYTVETHGCGVEGYVICASGCENLTVNNCDLFGCGLNGLSLHGVTGFSADNTVIRDCMYNIMDLYDCDNIELTNCVMKNNAYDEEERGYYNAIDGENSSVKFVDCEFADNLNYEFYDESKINVQFENCNFTGNVWQAAEEDTQKGDVNGDEEVNAKDVTMLRRYIAGGYGTEVTEKIADTNGDGEVDAKDVTMLRRFIAGGYGIELN